MMTAPPPEPRPAPPPEPTADPLVGRVIADRYLIIDQLGEGGMGRVYVGEHVKMHRRCAVKVMHPALVHDAEATGRFAREAANAARIMHPNVATVFDFGETTLPLDEGPPARLVYLVMEHVEGETLALILAREAPLETRRALGLARQIAEALGAAPALGIVPRHLKPAHPIVPRLPEGPEGPQV